MDITHIHKHGKLKTSPNIPGMSSPLTTLDNKVEDWKEILESLKNKDSFMASNFEMGRLLLGINNGHFSCPKITDTSTEAFFKLLQLLRESGVLDNEAFWGDHINEKDFIASLINELWYNTPEVLCSRRMIEVLCSPVEGSRSLTVNMSALRQAGGITPKNTNNMTDLFRILWCCYKTDSPEDDKLQLFRFFLTNIDDLYDTYDKASKVMITILEILDLDLSKLDYKRDVLSVPSDSFWMTRFFIENCSLELTPSMVNEGVKQSNLLLIEYVLEHRPELIDRTIKPDSDMVCTNTDDVGDMMTNKRARDIICRYFVPKEWQHIFENYWPTEKRKCVR